MFADQDPERRRLPLKRLGDQLLIGRIVGRLVHQLRRSGACKSSLSWKNGETLVFVGAQALDNRLVDLV